MLGVLIWKKLVKALTWLEFIRFSAEWLCFKLLYPLSWLLKFPSSVLPLLGAQGQKQQ